MKEYYSLETVVKQLQEYFKSDNPIIQQFADYLEGTAPMPEVVNGKKGRITMLNWFASRVGREYVDKLLDVYFKDLAVLTEHLFENVGTLMPNAHSRWVGMNKSSKVFYTNWIGHSWHSQFLLFDGDILTEEEKKEIIVVTEDKLSTFGKYLITQGEEEAQLFFDVMIQDDEEGDYASRIYRNLSFFNTYFASLLQSKSNFGRIAKYKNKQRYSDGNLRSWTIRRLIEIDSKTYIPLLDPYLKFLTFDFHAGSGEYLILKDLYALAPKKYHDLFLKFINRFLDFFTVVKLYPYGNSGLESKQRAMKAEPLTQWNIPSIAITGDYWAQKESILKYLFESLREIAPQEFEEKIENFCKHTCFVAVEVIEIVRTHFEGEKRLALLMSILKIKNIDTEHKYYPVLMEAFEGLDWSEEVSELWKFGCAMKEARMQVFVAKKLAEKPKVLRPFLEGDLAKKKGERQLVLLTLSKIDSTFAKDELWKKFHLEKDEKVRHFLLPIVTRKYYDKDLSRKEVSAIVQAAEGRYVLSSIYLDEIVLGWKNLPALYFKDGKKLSKTELFFLGYRMAQIKTMVSDPEAKLLINHIDKTKSNAFAKAILEQFLEKGAVAKQKYIMCLAGILGDESLLDYLKKLFVQLHDDKRLKMAQYVISTIAMIGTDKALRHVEYISRKYKRKASLEAAAIQALEDAAEELGMDMYELSDRIIPDFGFDGLYKTIEAGEEEIRVFVAKDFKLQYITEDNKTRKSPPKAVSKETKAQLKIIQKEIREVNRAQKERLEQYMVLERRWVEEDWRKFYLMNPVMFIYASTLVWGVFNEKNEVQQLFYVDEDASILNVEADEIELKKGKIGIVHPLRLAQKDLKVWQNLFFENDIVQPFDQLNRPVYCLTEQEDTALSIERYQGKSSRRGGRSTQGHFEKRGWRKEVSDGGCFDLSKKFKQEDIYAFLSLLGLCIGYYDVDVEFYSVTFRKIGDHGWGNENAIQLKDVPAIVFSEVIADMEGIVKGKEEDA